MTPNEFLESKLREGELKGTEISMYYTKMIEKLMNDYAQIREQALLHKLTESLRNRYGKAGLTRTAANLFEDVSGKQCEKDYFQPKKD